jgi:DNA topoisomerase-2
MPPKKKTYKHIGMREHIKKRSMWAGSKANQAIDTYHLVDGKKFSPITLRYPPALLKMIDEIVVNAIDHHVTYPKLVKNIQIDINDDGVISVMNDGPGIPLDKVKNKDGVEMYTPQMIFTEFLAGSNLDDEETKERVVGGQNGLGAKITAVFSDFFTVETVDSGKKYTQTFRDGLLNIEPPTIKAFKGKPYTKFTFLPTYAEFKIDIGKRTRSFHGKYALVIPITNNNN